MKPEAQRIAIAQACGATNFRKEEIYMGSWWTVADWPGWIGRSIPDYCGDLNAMHEAEKVLTEAQAALYAGEVEKVFTEAQQDTYAYSRAFAWLHATAAQRAEAFLRTLNLWTDK